MVSAWLVIFFSVLVWSAVHPKDYFTWMLEVSPAPVGLVVLVITYKKFRLTCLGYFLILIHSIIPIEWWVAVFTGESAEAFLGTQGYIWDTQSDMALALPGAVVAMLLLGRYHDRQLKDFFLNG